MPSAIQSENTAVPYGLSQSTQALLMSSSIHYVYRRSADPYCLVTSTVKHWTSCFVLQISCGLDKLLSKATHEELGLYKNHKSSNTPNYHQGSHFGKQKNISDKNAVTNVFLVDDPTVSLHQLVFPKSVQDWSGHCGPCQKRLVLTDSDLCYCGDVQTMSHSVESCLSCNKTRRRSAVSACCWSTRIRLADILWHVKHAQTTYHFGSKSW